MKFYSRSCDTILCWGHQRSPETVSLQDPRGASGGHTGLLQDGSQLGHWANSKRSPRPSRAQEADHGHLQESKQVKFYLLNKGTHLFKVAFVVSNRCRRLSGEAVKSPASYRPWRSSIGPWTSNMHQECVTVQNTWEPLLTLYKMIQICIKIHLIVLVLFLFILYFLCSDVFWLDGSVFTSQAGAPDKTALLHRGQGQMLLFFLAWMFYSDVEIL